MSNKSTDNNPLARLLLQAASHMPGPEGREGVSKLAYILADFEIKTTEQLAERLMEKK